MSFLNPTNYPFLKPLKDHWEEIKGECEAISGMAKAWPSTIPNEKWRVIPLRYFDRVVVPDAPITLAAGDAPLMCNLAFSIAKAGCKVPAHTDVFNCVRGHLCLTSNPYCGIRVGKEIRSFVEGEIIIFDESIEHETWNYGGTDRHNVMFAFIYDTVKGLPYDMSLEGTAKFFKEWWDE